MDIHPPPTQSLNRPYPVYNLRPSSAERAACAGLLAQICEYVTFTQLKQMRQVCHAWYTFITPLRRMTNCTGRFGKEWLKEVSGMDYNNSLRFRSIAFHTFPFHKHYTFKHYWEFIGGNSITKLTLKSSSMPCSEMVTFLETLPHLQEISFIGCKFKEIEFNHVVAAEGRNRLSYKTRCTHVQGLVDLNLPPEGRVPPRIHSIRLRDQEVFPLCVLDLLKERSVGILETFQYSDTRLPPADRNLFQPRRLEMETRFLEMVQASRAVMTNFAWNNVGRGMEFLGAIRENGVVLENILQVSLGPSQSHEFNVNHVVGEMWRLAFNFLTHCVGPNVQSVHLDIISFFHPRVFTLALETKTLIRNLSIDICAAGPALNIDLTPLVQNFPNLESLTILDRGQRLRPAIMSNYLPILPITLRKLHFFGREIPFENVTTYITSEPASLLKTLTITSGGLFTNEAMQLVINHLPQLEELGILNSPFLTDSGLTGLTDQAVERIVQSGIMPNYPVEEAQLTGKRISDLKYLRKLSVSNCKKITDVSLCHGLKFPDIKEIDVSGCLEVTDVGSYWLAKNNPSLERVELQRNLKITRHGLNQLVTEFPSILSIVTSNLCRTKKKGEQAEELNNVESPRFYRVVTYPPRE